ncbi:putative FAD carrier protein FLX1 [Ophiocordyceps camponoti-floridani]|uniref:Putative FAD carrier protein FLX1 n=1 Tax=Ophiocordyceps camponoti-floridani TaxID=2030778 RepID=A0A8H4QCI5_9HYPO|nr:putative FAD carrier protein FLX1 [Ophiocordyceps camponoti-floridani]
MPKTNNAGPSPAVVEWVAGLCAGTVATLVVHPLDIVKTRMQLHRGERPTTMAVLRGLTRTSSLYRGLTPNLVGNATGWATFFSVKARAERFLAGEKGQPSAADVFFASAGAGAATAALTNPVWVLKTRMLSTDRGTADAYPSMLAGARRVLETEGVRGFYRGLGVSLLGVSHGAVQFAVYEPAKRLYLARRRQDDHDEAYMSTEATMALSTGAKLVAGAVTYPYQVLRSRLQNQWADERFGRGFLAVVSSTWRLEGIGGFYRGLVPGVVRVMPATWVTFLVYEKVKYHLPRCFD